MLMVIFDAYGLTVLHSQPLARSYVRPPLLSLDPPLRSHAPSHTPLAHPTSSDTCLAPHPAGRYPTLHHFSAAVSAAAAHVRASWALQDGSGGSSKRATQGQDPSTEPALAGQSTAAAVLGVAGLAQGGAPAKHNPCCAVASQWEDAVADACSQAEQVGETAVAWPLAEQGGGCSGCSAARAKRGGGASSGSAVPHAEQGDDAGATVQRTEQRGVEPELQAEQACVKWLRSQAYRES